MPKKHIQNIHCNCSKCTGGVLIVFFAFESVSFYCAVIFIMVSGRGKNMSIRLFFGQFLNTPSDAPEHTISDSTCFGSFNIRHPFPGNRTAADQTMACFQVASASPHGLFL